MPVPDYFKSAFDVLSINDSLGHPSGELAYGYLRVSSSGQADEDRSGLPRQMQNIHQAALEKRLKIPWGYLFADDDSGFDFVHRPELSRLRQEYRTTKRRAHAIVIEHLDRLSRNADWHQGFLLDEMKQFSMQVVFWKEFSSRIERAVMGAVAQDGMEKAKQRMLEGNLHKARSGRVTAKTRAYGYKFVDSLGQEGPTAKKDTYYAIYEAEAQAVRYIYRKILEGYPMRRIAVMLEDKYPPPGRFKYWEPKMVAKIAKKRLYKGEFIAHRMMEIKVPVKSQTNNLTDVTEKMVTRRIQRPPEEWIIVPIPAIIPEDDWGKVNKILSQNKGRRKAKYPFLLTGLISCSTCNHQYVGRRRKEKRGKKNKEYVTTSYRCAGRASRVPSVREKIGCDQKQISMRILDQAVWSVIYGILLSPEIMINALEQEYGNEENTGVREQINFLEKQIKKIKLEDEKMYKAYLAEAFDETEYAEHRETLKNRQQKLEEGARSLQERIMSPEEFEERKQEIYIICQNAVKSGLAFDAPFKIQKQIINTIVDKITLNANEAWFELEGVIQGQYLFPENKKAAPDNGTTQSEIVIEKGSIVCNPKDMGSLPQLIEN